MRDPDFFILGAPKCGTTSLAAWLAGHPKIYMSSYKEPHFFNTDDKRVVETLDHYRSFFAGAVAGHLAVGEASVWYLSSANAVPNILAFAPAARFIVMVRNPVEMAPALHGEMLLVGVESVPDFAAAWAAQGERRAGRSMPKLCWEPRWLQYGDICKLGAQIARLFASVPRERVLVVLLDDVRRDARREYLRVLRFLGVPDDGRTEFPALNPAKVRRARWVPLVSNIVVRAKRRLGIRGGLGLWRRVEAATQEAAERKPLDPELEKSLRAYFADDVALLGRLIGRDLETEWQISRSPS